MTHDIRAVFLDIDGTIFHDGQLVDSAHEAVSKLVRNGYKVALCTGRSIMHTKTIQHTLQLENAVYFNGGLVAADNEFIASSPMQPEVVERAVAFSELHGIHAILHTQTRTISFQNTPSEILPLLAEYDYPPVQSVALNEWSVQDEHVYQLNVFMTQTWDQKVQNDFPECLLYRWADIAVDLQKRGCDKAKGAAALLEKWGLSPSQAVHIGDGGNDIGMFQTVGFSVAMGNATPEVQQYATTTTLTVEQHGAYEALRKLGLIE